MLRHVAVLGLLPILLAPTPAAALTAKEKMETCTAGADIQALKDAKRSAFIKRCMAKGNYEPAARRKANKPAAKKPAAATPAPKQQ